MRAGLELVSAVSGLKTHAPPQTRLGIAHRSCGGWRPNRVGRFSGASNWRDARTLQRACGGSTDKSCNFLVRLALASLDLCAGLEAVAPELHILRFQSDGRPPRLKSALAVRLVVLLQQRSCPK